MKFLFVFGFMLGAPVFSPQAVGAQVIRATYFDDGKDKMAIPDLRAQAKQGGLLTEEEQAVLRAANRIGEVQFPGCLSEDGFSPGGNAFLVRIGVRDAVITSAHIIVDSDTRQFKNGCSIENVRQALYLPNVSYLDHPFSAAPLDHRNPILQAVAATLNDSLGVPSQHTMIVDSVTDYVVLFLDEPISHLPSLDGQKRGAFDFAPFPRFGQRPIVMLGYDNAWVERAQRIALTWQTCLGRLWSGKVFHTCDTLPSVSGSVIAVFEEGEYRAVALHAAGESGQDDTPQPLPSSWFDWNVATSLSALVHALERQGR